MLTVTIGVVKIITGGMVILPQGVALQNYNIFNYSDRLYLSTMIGTAIWLILRWLDFYFFLTFACFFYDMAPELLNKKASETSRSRREKNLDKSDGPMLGFAPCILRLVFQIVRYAAWV